MIIAGGGTGGHLIPALNIARELRFRHPDIEIIFVGTQRGIERDLVPREGFDLELLPVVSLSRRPSTSWFRFPFALLKSVKMVSRMIRRIDADVILATGGYVSGPAMIAAWLRRRPLVLCAQNSYPGLTTRIGSLFAKVVCTGLPGAKEHLWRRSAVRATGNPVDFYRPKSSREEIIRGFELNPDLGLILATGGSQGAASINRALTEMLKTRGLPDGYSLLWQTGKNKYYGVLSEIGSVPENVAIVPFISPMSEAYLAADMAIGRCGALTLSEIALFGLPAILIPYPYATADHQMKNARVFGEVGAAIVIPDEKLDGEALSKAIDEITGDDAHRKEMAEAAASLGKETALREIADIVEEIANKRHKDN